MSHSLAFYDHHRQNYGHLPIARGAAEFMVGDYAEPGAGVGYGGEFKITLIELQHGSPGPFGLRNTRLHPHLEIFGDAVGSLRTAIGMGLLDQLEPVDTRERFALRLIDIGIPDRSDLPMGSPPPVCPCCGKPRS